MALRVWYDALAPGGVLLLKVPDKRYTFDSRRSRTPLAHLVAEYEHPELFDWRSHYAEFVENVHGRQPMEPELSQAAADLQAAKFNIHYHAWIDADLREILDYTRQVWNFDWHTVSIDKYPQVAQDGSRNIADVTDTFGDLDVFRRHGGKLLTFVGGNDQARRSSSAPLMPRTDLGRCSTVQAALNAMSSRSSAVLARGRSVVMTPKSMRASSRTISATS